MRYMLSVTATVLVCLIGLISAFNPPVLSSATPALSLVPSVQHLGDLMRHETVVLTIAGL